MYNTILSDYAIEAHTEKFYLRAILRRNNEIIKIIDISGKVRKQTLFNTKSKPITKDSYTIEIENLRKAGIVLKDYDFQVLDFDRFFKLHNAFYVSPKLHNLTYRTSTDSIYTKINATEKERSEYGHNKFSFIVNNKTFNFEKAILEQEYTDDYTKFGKDLKNKTLTLKVESDFTKNNINSKMQISKCNINIKVDAFYKNQNDIIDLTFIYFATPISDETSVKDNINYKKDIFDLKFDYNQKYWENHEVLPLTKEMQDFVNKANSSGKNSDFRTESNMK